MKIIGINKIYFIGKQSCSFIYTLSVGAFTQQCQSLVVAQIPYDLQSLKCLPLVFLQEPCQSPYHIFHSLRAGIVFFNSWHPVQCLAHGTRFIEIIDSLTVVTLNMSSTSQCLPIFYLFSQSHLVFKLPVVLGSSLLFAQKLISLNGVSTTPSVCPLAPHRLLPCLTSVLSAFPVLSQWLLLSSAFFSLTVELLRKVT